MSLRTKVISKLSTLEAARGIFFIVVGLAIRQSIALFSQDPPTNIAAKYQWWERGIIGIGYIVTALRFTHGISMLYGYEKELVEKSTLPSPRRVFLLSAFLSLLGILFYLMADNITHIRTFMVCTALMFSIDLAYVVKSGVIRAPKLTKRRWKQTVGGSTARAALQWIISDLVLILVSIVILSIDLFLEPFATIHMVELAGILILAAFVDYGWNREFYFGGKEDKRRQDIVFVCSPLQGGDMTLPLEDRMRDNIRRAQWYCNNLMQGDIYDPSSVIPFASHSFYVYFLHDNKADDRIIGQDCAIAYLHACDAIYVYLPYVDDYRLKLFGSRIRLFKKKKPDESQLSKGMRLELGEAKRLGLRIQYYPQMGIHELPQDWSPIWNPLRFEEPKADLETHFDPNYIRKRVFVCSYLRGTNFDNLDLEQRRTCLENNISAALWYCHGLVRLPSQDGKEEIAPFAPQAFYPYFWKVLDESGGVGPEWSTWFERSIEVLKVCDAVYFYVPGGLPDNGLLSDGMKRIKDLAERLGLEIQYKPTEKPPDSWKPALPRFLSRPNEPGVVQSLSGRTEETEKKKRVYFAAPLFTQAEWLWNARLAEALRGLGFDIILPQSTAEPMLKGTEDFNANKLFSANVSSIDSAEIILAILDLADPDSGTCWEYGYAYRAGIPIVGVRTDIRLASDDPTASVNLMLSQSWKAFDEVPKDKREELDWVAQRIAEMINQVTNS